MAFSPLSCLGRRRRRWLRSLGDTTNGRLSLDSVKKKPPGVEFEPRHRLVRVQHRVPPVLYVTRQPPPIGYPSHPGIKRRACLSSPVHHERNPPALAKLKTRTTVWLQLNRGWRGRGNSRGAGSAKASMVFTVVARRCRDLGCLLLESLAKICAVSPSLSRRKCASLLRVW